VEAFVNDGSLGTSLRAPVSRLYGEPPLSPPPTVASEAATVPVIPALRVTQPAPAPVAASQPAPVEAAGSAIVARVFVRLASGDRVEVAVLPELAAARRRAEEIVQEIQEPGEGWPFFAGRFVRPDAVVSVDLEAAPG
jgi:hypothetical protein